MGARCDTVCVKTMETSNGPFLSDAGTYRTYCIVVRFQQKTRDLANQLTVT